MLAQLLPERADNAYRGHKLAFWILGVVVLMRVAIALGSIFNGYGAASARVGDPPVSVINLVLLGLMITGFALSLWTRTQANPTRSE